MTFRLYKCIATLQRLIDQVLPCTPPLGVKSSLHQCDNLIMFTQGWDEHLRALRTILNKLRNMGWTANLKKCILGQRETQYLGFLVGKGKIKLLADRVEALKDYPMLHAKSKVQFFLCLLNYYCQLVPIFLELKALLTELTKAVALNKVWWTR